MYAGFIDSPGGSSDVMSPCIAHRVGDAAVVDCIREIRPPFSPEGVAADLKRYRLGSTRSDVVVGRVVGWRCSGSALALPRRGSRIACRLERGPNVCELSRGLDGDLPGREICLDGGLRVNADDRPGHSPGAAATVHLWDLKPIHIEHSF